MVCPNRVLKRVSTALDASNLYNGVVDCDWLQFDEQKSLGDFYVVDRKLVLDNLQDPVSVKVMTMQGQIMMDLNRVENTPVSLLDLDAGVYLFQVTTALGTNTKRFEVK
jgi:hypothetical protein